MKVTGVQPSWRQSKVVTVFRVVSYAAVISLLLVTSFLLLAVPQDDNTTTEAPTAPLPLALGFVTWSISQWVPHSSLFWKQRALNLQNQGWKSFEQRQDTTRYVRPLEIPVLDFSDPAVTDPLTFLETTYGSDWRERPLLLKGLWNATALNDKGRRLSLEGLSQEPMTIPYFTDARQAGALSPDAAAPISQIVQGIQHQGRPYKIGSQLFLRQYPSLLAEVAPLDIVTQLFGDRFTQDRLLGHIQSPINILRGPLTVPLFVANGNPVEHNSIDDTTGSAGAAAIGAVDGTCQSIQGKDNSDNSACAAGGETSLDGKHHFNSTTISTATATATSTSTTKPFTGLHCEPIGNVAVNLAGTRQWTLVDPQYSHLLRPAVSPDSRGFFASWAPSIQHVPRYEAIRTLPGDAVWVPPWTWHRVDYVTDERAASPIAMGASLFHFRPLDFVRRNPLYAVLLFPYLVGELLGSKTQ